MPQEKRTATMRSSLLSAIFSASLVLWGCGGGGGGGSSTGSTTAPTALIPQTISFAVAGPVQKSDEDSSFANPAQGGAGSGAFSYTSSNTNVANVDATGSITMVGVGSTTIAATKAADANYAAAQANYTLVVTAARYVPFSAWLGAANTEVFFPPEAVGADFLRSTSPGCDLVNFVACATRTTLTSPTVTDTVMGLASSGASYWLQRGSAQSKGVAITRERFAERADHAAAVLNGKLWLVAGDPNRSSDVWSTDDGRAWTIVRGGAFSGRAGHQLVSFNGRLWLIGGATSAARLNDVWSSVNGAFWERVTASAQFSPRHQHQVVVMNNRMWLIGGESDTGLMNDVWSSTDGATWTRETPSAPFRARFKHQSVAFKDRLWVTGGIAGSPAVNNEVWSSADGIAWRREADAPFAARFNHAAAVYAGKIWVTGGRASTLQQYGDVWFTEDGTNWTLANATPAFSPRESPTLSEFNGRLWLVAGDDDSTDNCCFRSDAWSTTDGVTWRYEHTAMPIPTLHPLATVWNGKLWAIARGPGPGVPVQVWSYTDGGVWAGETANSGMPFDVGVPVGFNGRLWLVGGTDGSIPVRGEVWSSVDGKTWNRVVTAAPFGGRRGHGVFAFQSKLWLIGGLNSSGTRQSDVWSSVDGANWTQELAIGPFAPRWQHAVVAFDNKLWIIGGFTALVPSNDVWSSADGVNWTQATAAAEFPARFSHQALAHDGKLWVIGGKGASDHLNDVWSSSNGVSWQLVMATAPFVKRSAHASVSFGNKLWVMGGINTASEDRRKTEIWSSPDGLNWSLQYQNLIRVP